MSNNEFDPGSMFTGWVHIWNNPQHQFFQDFMFVAKAAIIQQEDVEKVASIPRKTQLSLNPATRYEVQIFNDPFVFLATH